MSELRRYEFSKGERFRVWRYAYGCLEIERIDDGATLFLQGGDIVELESELESRYVDDVCGDYEHCLKVES
jgi:hypothetical protein